jgi:hypothetical protein
VNEMNGLIVGESYLFESVNKFWLGRLVSVDGPYSVRIKEVSWIADTGRFSEFMREGKSAQMEVEALPDEIIQGIQWLHWFYWPHPLLRKTV